MPQEEVFMTDNIKKQKVKEALEKLNQAAKERKIKEGDIELKLANGLSGVYVPYKDGKLALLLKSLPGPQGIKGVKGEIGDIGPEGLLGRTGPQGIKGDKGNKGPRGFTGITGPKGEIGNKGGQGEKGLIGSQGVPGPEGVIGLFGPKGDIGKIGERGEKGIEGPKGPKGEKGFKGDRGEYGVRGATGSIGSKGEAGLKGDIGLIGPQGEIGKTPRHRWDRTKLQFENPKGSWGPLVDLQGSPGEGDSVLRPAIFTGPKIHERTSDPTVNDDSYKIGDTWINLTSDEVWILVDNTKGAAVWIATDIAAHAAIAGAHHSRYTDTEAVVAVQAADPLNLAGDVVIASGKTLTVGELLPTVLTVTVAGLEISTQAGASLLENAFSNIKLGTPVGAGRGIALDAGGATELISAGSGGVALLTNANGSAGFSVPAAGVIEVDNLRLNTGGVIQDGVGDTRFTPGAINAITGALTVSGLLTATGEIKFPNSGTGILDAGNTRRITVRGTSFHLQFDGNALFKDIDGNTRLAVRNVSPHASYTGDMAVHGRMAVDRDALPSVPIGSLLNLEGVFTSVELAADVLVGLKVVPEFTLTGSRDANADSGIGGSLDLDITDTLTLGDAYGVDYGVNISTAFLKTGTVTKAFGVRGYLKSGLSGTTVGTDWGAVLAAAPTKEAFATWTVGTMSGFLAENQGIAGVADAYGVRVLAQSGATANWGLGIEGTQPSFIQGPTLVGADAAPLSTLEVRGSFAANITALSSNTTLDDTHFAATCDASGGAFTVTLPAASGATRRIYHIKKIDSSGNVVTVDGNASETIDRDLTKVISVQYDSMQIICTGSEWFII